MYRSLFIVLLSCLVYIAQPAAAQVRPDEISRVRRDLRQSEESARDAARTWARARRLPLRVAQRDGRIVELVAVSNGRPIYLTSANNVAANVTGTDVLHPGGRLGLGLTGAGLEIGVWDGGHPLHSHRELSGRVSSHDKADVSDHATHIAGTLAAAGVDDKARGMAFESHIRAYTWINDATEMSNEADRGMLVSNHSYTVVAGWYYGDIEDTGDQWYWLGDPKVSATEDYGFGWYDLGAVQYDRVTYTSPYFLPVVAAGNERLDRGPRTGTYRALNEDGVYQTYDVGSRPIPPDGAPGGFDTVSGAGVAKNVLTVGSVRLNPATGSVNVSAFSSFGPTDDGRIKPDLVGLGEGIYSSSSSGTGSYQYSSGTSMAAPNVAGSILLLQEHYFNSFGAYMRAATLKGLALHTATDLGNPGPDYSSGWGLLNVESGADHISSSMTNPAGIMEEILSDGETFSRELTIGQSGPVRVTLAWTDHPSSRHSVSGPSSLDNPASHLRNDLDVRLIHLATGNTYYPYVLDLANPGSPASTGDNRIDPVEQIYIPRADTGTYAITVTHKRSLYAGYRQPFSLLISGIRDDSVPVAIARLNSEVTPEGVTLRWSTLFERKAGSFVVERGKASEGSAKNLDDDRFVAVGSLDVAASGGRDYEFSDRWSISGRYVYRIVYEDGENRFIAATATVNIAPPDEYSVLSSYPNPFQDETTIVLDLPKTQQVNVEIFDALGRRVLLLHEGVLSGGRHRISLRAGNWPSGVYFARITTPNGVTGHRMLLVR